MMITTTLAALLSRPNGLSPLGCARPRTGRMAAVLRGVAGLLVVLVLALFPPRFGMTQAVAGQVDGVQAGIAVIATAHDCCLVRAADTGTDAADTGKTTSHGLACQTLCAGGIFALLPAGGAVSAGAGRPLPRIAAPALPMGRGEGPDLRPPRAALA